jgi:tryptophan-rich hypothetical protein
MKPSPEDPSGASPAEKTVRRNPLSPKKLLLTKWTAVAPLKGEKHFVVVRIIEPVPPAVRIDQVELEAVYSKRVLLLNWRELTDGSVWSQGWV